MRFMMLYKSAKEAAGPPSQEEMAAMGKFIEDMSKSGILLATDGLLPSALGARVRISKGKFTVTDGPFTESKELIAGFWMIQVKSKEEAIEWFKRCPAEVEIRQVFDAAELAPAISTAEGRAVMEAEHEFRKRTNT